MSTGERSTPGVLDTDDRVERALQIAYRYLNRRERTQAEVRRRLAGDGIDGAAIEQAIASLIENGLLDDIRHARLFVEDKRELEGWGGDRIRRTLLARGIEPDVVERALEDEDSNGDSELERALALLRRRFPMPPRERRDRDRALGMLLRKGYECELAVEALGVYARDADESEFR